MNRISRGCLALAISAALLAPAAYAAHPEMATMNLVQNIGTIDPAKITDYTEYMAAVNLYDGLTNVGANGEILPRLAESWKTSDDGKTVTFALKKNAKFQDGTPVEAKDVVWSVKRLLTLNLGPSNFFSGTINADSVSAPDAHTVQFKLLKPSSTFLSTTPLLFVLNSTLAQKNQDKGGWAESFVSGHAIGSGPYSLANWQRGSSMVLQRFNDYEGGFPAHPLDKVRLLITSDESTVKALANKGELQITSVYQSEETLNALAKLPNYKIETIQTGTEYYLKLNHQRAPTDDINIRKAIAAAVDYDTINTQLHPGTPASGPLPAIFKGAHLDSLQPPKMDLKQAAAFIAKSKYAGQKNIPLVLGYVSGTEFEEEVALLLQSSLETIGFKVTLEPDPWSRVTEIAGKPATTPNVNQIFFGPTYPSPDSVFYNQYSSKSAGGWASMSWINDKNVDKMINDARSELNEGKRNAIYQQLQQYLVDDQSDVYVQSTQYRIAIDKCISPVQYVPMQSFYFNFSSYHWTCE